VLRRLLASIGGLRRRRDIESETDDELRFHLEMATRRNVERGMSPEHARRQALATFGGFVHHRESAHDAVPGQWLDGLRQDLRYAVRSLRRNAGFATTVVLTLALGIGANTAIFSVVNGVLLRPLPVRDPEQLAYVGWTFGKSDTIGALSALEIDYLRRNATAFSAVTTYRTSERNLGSNQGVRPVRGLRVAPEFFDVIGSAPAIGRGFGSEEETPGGPAAVVLSEESR